MSEKKSIDIWLVVDENGDYGVGYCAEAAKSDYESTWQGLGAAECLTTYQLILDLPKARPVCLRGSFPDGGGPLTLTALVQVSA